MNDFGTFFLILISISVFYVYLENKAADVTYVKHNKIELNVTLEIKVIKLLFHL